MLNKILKKYRPPRMTMKVKLSCALGAIAAILLLSSVISIVEYGRMSNYVSDLIATDINSINTAQKLASSCSKYNLEILAAIGENEPGNIPVFDDESFVKDFNALRSSLSSDGALQAADSVLSAYALYIETSMELDQVMKSDFLDVRQWYFDSLQPSYNRFCTWIENLDTVIYTNLERNSETFQDGFYRSIMPGVVSVGVGLLLVILLLFFIISYYVDPIYRMVRGLDDYRSLGRRYTCTFDGEDELVAINAGVSDIIEENMELKKRLAKLREEKAL